MSLPAIAPYRMPEAGDLPSPRTGWRPCRQRAALLIHDMQHYFVDIFDTRASPMTEALSHIQLLAERCRALDIPVIYTAQPRVQEPAARGLLQDWWGPGITARPELAPVHDTITPAAGDLVLEKHRYSGFSGTDLAQMLADNGRDQLMICGVYAYIGCMATALDAFMRDIQPFFIADAMGDLSEADHHAAIDFVARRCGIATATRDILNALAQPDRPALPTADAVRAQVAELLEVDPQTIDHQDDLARDHGLDSMRLMSLVEGWRAAGFEVSFVELGHTPTIAVWSGLLAERQPVTTG